MIALHVSFTATPGAVFVAPMGLAIPSVSPVEVTCEGARLRVVGAPEMSQMLLCGTVEAPEVTLRYALAPGGPAYPDAMFRPVDSRFTRFAAELAEETRGIAEAAGGGEAGMLAIIRHVAGLFDYGHTEDRFYDGHDAIPQLCGTIKGSCVDINAYVIAGLRAAGYEAGYIYGPFIPEEKKTWAADMHCWVVTRHDGIVQEWDIAHHLKMGTRDVRPALNPKPGVRVAMSHSMGWQVPALGIAECKVMGPPLLCDAGALALPDNMALRFDGYDALYGRRAA